MDYNISNSRIGLLPRGMFNFMPHLVYLFHRSFRTVVPNFFYTSSLIQLNIHFYQENVFLHIN